MKRAIVLALVAAGLCTPIHAQTTDRLCSSLIFLANRTGDEPFRDFEIDERTGRRAPFVMRPAGFEGAFECKIKHLDKSVPMSACG
jgi:hypothetical protein